MAKAMLVNRALDIAGSPPAPNADEGWGRVDLGAMVRPAVPTLELDQEHLLDDTGATSTLEVVVPDPARPLVVTLTWTDAPAAPGADPALVNDLDLVVETNGAAALGNAATASAAAMNTTPDRLNNVEQVRISQPGPTARVTVTAYRIAGDGVPLTGDASDQDFALVCSNCNRPPPPPRPGARRVVP